jgi:ABC-type sugar transport system, ATPase component
MKNETILELDSVTKLFPGTKALSEVSFSVTKGEVHAVIGENGAGKSTLMNIIGGIFSPTSGSVKFHGEEVRIFTPQHAQLLGIGFVHQEMSLCPHVSVAENIFIGRLPQRSAKVVNFRKLYEDCEKVLSDFDVRLPPQEKVSNLTVAQQQVVEIAKALSLNCKLLILDEPTASLTVKETEELFAIVRRLRNEGISMLYISHRLSEITELADRVTILRDGKWISTNHVADITVDQMISMMVGRTLDKLYPEKSVATSEVLLRIENMTGERFSDIGFSLRKGEILGFSGLIGAGRTELMRAVCNIDRRKNGTVFLGEEKLTGRRYRSCLDKGLVYMTEDRKGDGLFLGMDVQKNIVATVLRRINGFLFKESNADKISGKYVNYLNIKISSLEQLCGNLSGGNQQKVLFGKSLAVEPKVLIVDEPTRGIDVGAKFEVYKILRELCRDGVGIIVVSSDLPEVIGLCDRVMIMYEGRMSGELSGDDITEENIMKHAAAYTQGGT